jgi:nickel transport protein
MKFKHAGILLGLVLVFGMVGTAFAHGAKIDYTVDLTVNLQAMFDTGEPMSGGQVAVYAPDDPSKPWLTGTCDENGYFSFTPDPNIPGTWDVQVRHQGHGDMIHIEVGEAGGMTMGGTTGYTPGQIVIMAVCVIWGFVGTGLFFSRKRSA